MIEYNLLFITLGYIGSCMIGGMLIPQVVLTIRTNKTKDLSIGFLFVDIMLCFLVCIQVYLGDKLVWIYGLHTVPVVNAIRDGII